MQEDSSATCAHRETLGSHANASELCSTSTSTLLPARDPLALTAPSRSARQPENQDHYCATASPTRSRGSNGSWVGDQRWESESGAVDCPYRLLAPRSDPEPPVSLPALRRAAPEDSAGGILAGRVKASTDGALVYGKQGLGPGGSGDAPPWLLEGVQATLCFYVPGSGDGAANGSL